VSAHRYTYEEALALDPNVTPSPGFCQGGCGHPAVTTVHGTYPGRDSAPLATCGGCADRVADGMRRRGAERVIIEPFL
jgi:hypothetical protein